MTTRPALLLLFIGLGLGQTMLAPNAHAQDKAPAKAAASGDSTSVTLFRAKAKARVTVEKPDEQIYSGIIPGSRDEVAHISRAVQKSKSDSSLGQLSWIGFLPEKTRTRVFLQTPGVDNYEVVRSDDRKTLTLTLTQTKISTRNVTRAIDASAYNRKVTNIKAKRKGRRKQKEVQVRLTVLPSSEPQISRVGEFIYIDFSHEQPEEARTTIE